MRRGTAEYELDFNLNGRPYSETQLEVSRTRELSLEREIRFREILTDSRPNWPHHLSEGADHVILIKWHAWQAWKEPSGNLRRSSCRALDSSSSIIASIMADGSSPRQDRSDSDDDGSEIDYHNEEQLGQRLASMQQQLAMMGLIGGDIPEEPIARFKYLDDHARLYTARFLGDGSCLEEALSYSDQAKAQIPSQIETSLFRKPDGEGFGDRYVFLRLYAWHKDKNPQNTRRLVDAIEWKFDVAPGSRTLQDIGFLGLSKAGIYRQTKNAEDLAGAIQSCQDFISALRVAFEGVLESDSDPQDLVEQQELYPPVLSCLSQLLYHEFRSSGKYGLLELSIQMGNDVFIEVPDAERPDLAMSLVLAFIAYSFYHKIWDVPRSKQQVLDWSFLDEERPSTIAETSILHLDAVKALYDEFPLASDNSQIRLLQLKAGVGDDPVTCFLEVVDLEGCPAYDVSNLCKSPAVCFGLSNN